jgi:predicted AAA+ superfamily ATPase
MDTRLSLLLRAFGGVLIEGPKWCGKTWIGRRHSRSQIFVDDPAIRQRALLDTAALLEGDPPVLVDEWQGAPVLWDTARRLIDAQTGKGRFIFTGSATPSDGATSHTGTGRFARLRLRPMSLFEAGDSSGAVSLGALLDGAPIETCSSNLDYAGAIRLICRGGWPAGLGLDDDLAMLIPQQYIQSLAHFDLPRPDSTSRNPGKMMALLHSLARHTSTQAAIKTIHSDIAANAEDGKTAALSTLSDYIAALRRVFAVDDLPPWIYSLRSKSQIRVTPTHRLADPSLAAAALGATPQTLRGDPNTTGLLFESLAIRDLRVYAEARGGDVYHYRDNTNLEADAIVTDTTGRWGAVEVKLGAGQIGQAAATLLRLKRKLAGQVEPPAFLAIVTATTGVAHTRDDSVHVIPIDTLGP